MKAKPKAAKATKTASAKAPKAKALKIKLGAEIHDDEGGAQAAAVILLRQLPVRSLIPLCKATGVPVHKFKMPMVAKLAAYFATEGTVTITLNKR